MEGWRLNSYNPSLAISSIFSKSRTNIQELCFLKLRQYFEMLLVVILLQSFPALPVLKKELTMQSEFIANWDEARKGVYS